MNEWPGTLTRIDAIRIIENITDKDDPAWEWAVEDFYHEESDTFPTIYEVLQTLGVTEAEYKSATNAQNTNWPEVSDELYISQQVRIDSLEAELSTLKAENAALKKEQAAWRKFTDEANRTLVAADKKIAALKADLEDATEHLRLLGEYPETRPSEPVTPRHELEGEITTLRAQREWVSVEERLPEEGQTVVLLDAKRFVATERSHDNVMHVGCYSAFGNHWAVMGERGFILESFTHWMPLPSAPEGE
jgi:hypothetical protein